MFWCERGRHKLWDKHSDTNEAEDTESRVALASTEEPSGASTNTRNVMSSALDTSPAAALDETGLTVESEEGALVSFVYTYSRVWCGL